MNENTQEELRSFLDSHYKLFNAKEYLESYPDPLSVVYKHQNFLYFDELALICALYAYGRADMIVKNLSQMPFSLLLDSQKIASTQLKDFPYYRFQNKADTKACFFIIANIIEQGGIKKIFLEAYRRRESVLDGIWAIEKCVKRISDSYKLESCGLNFLFGNPKNKQAPLKRYNMFLRWMVRKDSLDFGLWSEVKTSKLLLPLDTHTFKISKYLGLCKTKTYNLKAVQEITQNLRIFNPDDPVKYDFALYRIGQLGLTLPSFTV